MTSESTVGTKDQMFDGMMTATEVRKLYGADTLELLQTMRILSILGPDRTQPNKYHGTTQLYKKIRVQEAALFAVDGVPDFDCRQAFFRGLFHLPLTAMTPEQQKYFEAGDAIKERLVVLTK